MRPRFIFPIVLALISSPAGAYECPVPTKQLAQDVSIKVKSDVSTLQGLATASFESSAETVTRDLFAKYQDAGVVALGNSVISIFCQIIMPSSMPDAQKLDQLYRLEEWITRISGHSVPIEKTTGTSCATAPNEILRPIKAVFHAWQQLDVDEYLAQWGPESIQRSKYYARRMADIADKRRRDFREFQSVSVISIDPKILFADGTKARVDNVYTMRFVRRNGSVIAESNVSESYILECSVANNSWRIRENNDYISRR
jgi:hypothetical protein